MKKIAIFIIVMAALAAFQPSSNISAMGPIFAGPSNATWDPLPAGQSAYLYWRTAGSSVWDNTKRTAKLTTNSFDLMSLTLPAGNYEICVTAVDAAGSESGPSNVIPFLLSVPASPKNLKLN